MAIFSADNRPLNLAVRALQIVLAIIVIGTVGYGTELILPTLLPTLDSDSIS
jgi:hypothetical protein